MPIEEFSALGNLATNIGLSLVIVIVIIVACWKGAPRLLEAYKSNNKELTDAIKDLSKTVGKRIDRLDQRMENIEDKVGELDVKIDTMNGQKGE